MSLRELEAATGIHRGLLSLMENRGLQPSAGEFSRIMAALDDRAAANMEEGSSPASPT